MHCITAVPLRTQCQAHSRKEQRKRCPRQCPASHLKTLMYHRSELAVEWGTQQMAPTVHENAMSLAKDNGLVLRKQPLTGLLS